MADPTVTALGGGLEEFNALPPPDARARVDTCLAVPRWVEAVVQGRPYVDRAALLAAADAAASELSDTELAGALQRHPRIGRRASADHDAAFSAREQSGVDGSDEDVAERLREGNLSYEKRFGRVFLIRAAGRDGPEILAELERRLGNDDTAERAETVSNLRQISLVRLGEVIRP